MADVKATLLRECSDLESYWHTRNTQMKYWYEILLLTNNLKQEGMESVIANDPRTAFNLALHLITSSVISHKISTEGLKYEEVVDTSGIEQFFSRRWKMLNREERGIGKQSWFREFVSLTLATGWYSVLAIATQDKLIAEIWNPAEVYPHFSKDSEIGMDKVVRIYPLTASEANRKAKLNGWTLPRPFVGDVKVYNYFFIDEDGDIANSIIMGGVLVVPPYRLGMDIQASNRIPVFVSPVGGLPDDGVIMSGKEWQKHFGESLIATDADEFNNQNKMLTYTQQTVRDTATPRWFERSTGKSILTPENLFKRGAIFRGGANDDIAPLPVPAMPVELRTIMFDYANRIQRGLFSWALMGNIQQQMSGYMMSQVASTTMGVLTPYIDALRDVLTDVDNYWFGELRARHLSPYKFKMPSNVPPEAKFEVDLNVNIPGSLIQRATIAKMINPDLQIDFATTCDLMFPEITNPIEIQAKVNKDKAMMGEIAQTVAMIESYREVARMSEESGDSKTSTLYNKAADTLEAQLTPQMPATTAPPGPARPSKEVRAAVPREEGMAPMEGM